MPRPPDILRPIRLTTTFPEDIRAKLDLLLWSDAEGRVPKGAYQKFLLGLIDDHLKSETLDLAELSGIIPPRTYYVRGKPGSIIQLKTLLGK